MGFLTLFRMKPDVKRRAVDAAIGLTVLEEVGRIVEPVDRRLYEDFENIARERVLARDPDHWPIVGRFTPRFADWTEDQDFFGSGVATWTTDRVELYLRAS
jgi:PIN domain